MSQPTNDLRLDRHKQRRKRTALIPTKNGSFLVTRASRVPLGLNNTHYATCYRNMVLQSLLHAPLLVNWTRLTASRAPHSDMDHKNANTCWICSFDRLARIAWGDVRRSPRNGEQALGTGYDGLTERGKAIRAKQEWHDTLLDHMIFHGTPQSLAFLSSTGQQDATEYREKVGIVIGDFPQMQPTAGPDYNLVTQGLFEIRIAERFICSTPGCGHVRPAGRLAESFWPLPTVAPGGQQLVNLIHGYFRGPGGPNDNCMYCTPCVLNNDSTARNNDHRILAAPRILLIKLNIGTPNYQKETITKHQVPTIFPPNLDLTQYAEPGVLGPNDNLRYRLSSVVAHEGSTFDSGHYVNWAKQHPGRYSELNDETVTAVTQQDQLRPPGGFTPYLLTYLAEDSRHVRAENDLHARERRAAIRRAKKTASKK